MAGWHHRLNGRESEWIPGDGDGQGGLACCDSWGRKESDMTELLNWTDSYVLQLDWHNISINSSFPLLYSDLPMRFSIHSCPLPTLFYEHYHLAHNFLLICFWQKSMYISCISTSFPFIHFLGTCLRYMYSVSLQGFHCSIYILPFMVTFMCISDLLLISQLISSYFKNFTFNMIHYYYTCAF